MHRTKRLRIVYSPKKMRPKISNNSFENTKNGTHLVREIYIKNTKISNNGSWIVGREFWMIWVKHKSRKIGSPVWSNNTSLSSWNHQWTCRRHLISKPWGTNNMSLRTIICRSRSICRLLSFKTVRLWILMVCWRDRELKIKEILHHSKD